MAGGHRYSLRHNVCRPATDAHICVYNRTNHLCEKCLSVIFLILYFIVTTLLVKIHILCTQKYGGRTSSFLTSQRMPSRYGCVHMLIQLCKYYTPSVASGHIPTHKFIHRTEIFDFVTERVKRCIAANMKIYLCIEIQ